MGLASLTQISSFNGTTERPKQKFRHHPKSGDLRIEAALSRDAVSSRIAIVAEDFGAPFGIKWDREFPISKGDNLRIEKWIVITLVCISVSALAIVPISLFIFIWELSSGSYRLLMPSFSALVVSIILAAITAKVLNSIKKLR